MDQVVLELSHNGRVVFFQAEKWEERHSARRAHGVLGQRGVNKAHGVGRCAWPEAGLELLVEVTL